MIGILPNRERKYYNRINPLVLYDDQDFLKRYRLSKNSYRFVHDTLHHHLERNTNRSQSLSPMDQILSALRYYACGSFQIVVGDTYGLSQASVNRAISSVSRALDIHWNEFVYFPVNMQEIRANKEGFYALAGFPNVLGCVDGTHIPIMRPKEFEWQYVNRKFYHSINVQGVCDFKGQFINMVVRHPGSTHDSFILRNSLLWNYMENRPDSGYLLGDSAYPCKPWLMTPLQNLRIRSERNYNYSHKRTRVLIENTFGRWKRRFPVLQFPNRRSLENAAYDIRATAILHNICIQRNDPLPDEDENQDLDNNDGPPVPQQPVDQSGNVHRLYLINNVFNR
ncbi:UNVERIFIED_CONTAM: hypothetical protein GTU68_037841 [Idotea baltica]|nr:hypothetical protein [Idotea baltica]